MKDTEGIMLEAISIFMFSLEEFGQSTLLLNVLRVIIRLFNGFMASIFYILFIYLFIFEAASLYLLLVLYFLLEGS